MGGLRNFTGYLTDHSSNAIGIYENPLDNSSRITYIAHTAQGNMDMFGVDAKSSRSRALPNAVTVDGQSDNGNSICLATTDPNGSVCLAVQNPDGESVVKYQGNRHNALAANNGVDTYLFFTGVTPRSIN